jgi:hypothetical protein
MAPEFLLVARPEIAHAADLKGKTVVDSGPGSTTELLAKLVAKRAGSIQPTLLSAQSWTHRRRRPHSYVAARMPRPSNSSTTSV